ncbi:hypothetical protein GcM1_250001 [Golovinomyces cichoracearum]|uniref:Uncharacterized protein n=1 Tax=Golovinomyces cichoracearum TaxID=62708 RepID=A0A420IAP5_9PEZI|nr:hypothetical protein GcM1_250001 [Golovinomyces cichoracearum]
MANDDVIKLDNIAEFQSGDGVKWLKKLKHELRAQRKSLTPEDTALLHEFRVKEQVAGLELSAAEARTLNSIKFKYIFGLSSAELQLEAINLQALLSSSLASCISIVNTAVKMLEQKKKLQEEIEVQQRLKTLELFDKQARTAGYNNLLSYAYSLDRHQFNNSMQMRPPTTNPGINSVKQQANNGQVTYRTKQSNRSKWH